MKASLFLDLVKQKLDIDVIAGVPDSTLKQFCDALHFREDFKHFTPANEGAAVGIAIGNYLKTDKPACVYMQNSGIGNIVNPVCSLANNEVYGIPMLFICGWRGEPGVHDEPQHVYQGKVTCKFFEDMDIPYSIIDAATDINELDAVFESALAAFAKRRQYAVIVKKGSFEKEYKFSWDNGNKLIREDALKSIVKLVPKNVPIVSTTGKISREVYEACDLINGNHDNVFLTVGGMGHASMIAYGLSQADANQKVVCIDGDGAALMHMGSLAFIASHAPRNFYHIVINNMAHESVGSMPTDCGNISFAKVALAAGYKKTVVINDIDELTEAFGKDINATEIGPVLYEINVSLGSRDDLGRPKESAAANRASFMQFLSNIDGE